MVIRALQPADFDALYAIYSDLEVVANNRFLPYISRNRFEAMFKDDQYNFVCCADDGEILGHLAIIGSNKPRTRHVVSFGIAVSKRSRGQGVGRQLMQHLIDYCDNWLNVRRIELEVHANNEAALGLYNTFGFELEGAKKQAVFVNGQFIDILLMARLNGRS